MEKTDEYYMTLALKEAKKAYKLLEVPVGAVLVKNTDSEEYILSKTFNQRETKQNGLYHAEIIAITKACKKLKSWRLHGTTLYVTLEPCPMCLGAAINSRIDRIVFGAYDKKAGACGSLLDLNNMGLNHNIEITSGIMEKECAGILTDFFTSLRKKEKK